MFGALFFRNAMFPLREEHEIIFRKKQRGLGYSVLRKQNTAIPKIWIIRQKICFAIPQKSENFAEKTARHHPVADSHAPALHRTGAYPAAGVRRVPRKKVISPYWEQSIAKKQYSWLYIVDCRPSSILFPVNLICRQYSLEKIKENKEFKEFKKFNFCYRYPLSYSPVKHKLCDSGDIHPFCMLSPNSDLFSSQE